jgi:hypothetical protein
VKKLEDIQWEDLEPYEFPGTHAAVLRLGLEISLDEIKEAFEGTDVQMRIYSRPDGYEVKFVYWEIEELITDKDFVLEFSAFEREEFGWDHEHCSFCHARVDRGQLAYTTEHETGGVYVLCIACAAEVTGAPNKTG